MENQNENTNTQQTETKESSAVDSVSETKNTDVVTEDSKTEEKISMTQQEFDKIIQKRLDREKKKAEAEKIEAEKLAKMSAEEKAKHEFEKEKSKFEEERKKYQLDKMELELIKQLDSKKLPVEFSKYLLSEDAETCLKNINEFEKVWQQAIQNAVNEKLKGTTPKVSSGDKINTVTKEQFFNMNYFEQQKFAVENPETYKQIIK
ncbi:hypothetical protein N493_07385 [Clostridium botulinum B2 433]|uniref:DUF4355 domain-containing protein n=1 Tax=Clostridium botulinum TaxID=1491 RepID=UPI0007E246C3|nr:DUF4355 domain-containing protein [Clostridium botulinum]KEI89324.1 hypothetical protein N493_07385 [Clostridium botulinum B2 433]